MRYKTTRFQWVCVTIMVCAVLLFLAWFIQAFFDYKVRLRAATCVWPAPAPAPAPATTTNVAITNGSPAGRLLAELSSTVRGLLAQDAALPAAAAAAENLPLLAPPPDADTAVVPFGAVMAPVVGMVASAVNTFAGVDRPVAENIVRLGGLITLMYPTAGPLATFGVCTYCVFVYISFIIILTVL